MPEKMLKFVDIDQQNPFKRDKIERKADFNEIYTNLSMKELRNSQAGVHSVECLSVRFIAH